MDQIELELAVIAEIGPCAEEEILDKLQSFGLEIGSVHTNEQGIMVHRLNDPGETGWFAISIQTARQLYDLYCVPDFRTMCTECGTVFPYTHRIDEKLVDVHETVGRSDNQGTLCQNCIQNNYVDLS